MYGNEKEILNSTEHKNALSVIGNLNPIHFPVKFPEVFLRKRAGFDVIIGNPPWEKARVEEHEFWAKYSPGLRGLNQRKRELLIQFLRETRPDLVTKLEDEVVKAQNLRNCTFGQIFLHYWNFVAFEEIQILFQHLRFAYIPSRSC